MMAERVNVKGMWIKELKERKRKLEVRISRRSQW